MTDHRSAPLTATVRLAHSSPVFRIPADFVSVTLDTSQFIGGYWWEGSDRMRRGVGEYRVTPFDFDRATLRTYARALAPAVLRVGGSEADRVYYDTGGRLREPPAGFDYVLSAARWEELATFAADMGMRVLFTVNAGPGPRGADRRWAGENARSLMAHAAGRGDPVLGWELGNEINAFPVIHGLRRRVSARRYARDFRLFSRIVRQAAPGTLAAGPASAFWPVLGEFQRVTAPFLRRVDGELDVLTWHYYPQQSDRGPVATRRAGLRTMLEPSFLDDAARILSRLAGYRRRHATASLPIWLGETGNAQFGGQEGVSDRFAGTLWWMDELGLMARGGVERVFRQTLAGADYGLLDYRSGEPNPDYWATLLWKRLLGPEVYALEAPADRRLRLYCHSRADGEPGAAILCINLAEREAAALALDPGLGSVSAAYELTADGLDSRTLRINGREPDASLLDAGAGARWTSGRTAGGTVGAERRITIPPLSVAIVLTSP
jgi:heparanase 1